MFAKYGNFCSFLPSKSITTIEEKKNCEFSHFVKSFRSRYICKKTERKKNHNNFDEKKNGGKFDFRTTKHPKKCSGLYNSNEISTV